MNAKHSIEQRLIAVGEGKNTNESFVARTMEKIAKASAGSLFSATLTPPKRPSPFQRFVHLPKYAMLAIAFGACALVSGTAYAAYSLWLSPSAQVRSVDSKYGRDQALIGLKNCTGSNAAVTVEITKGSTGTPQGAADKELARCEIQAIQSWSIQTFHAEPSDVLFPLSATKVSNTTLTVAIPGPAVTTQRSYHIDTDMPVVFQGKIIPLSELHVGDAVAIIRTDHLKAVVKLSLPITYYASDEVNNTYHDRQSCIGNTDASCISLPNLDVLRTGEGGANPDYTGSKSYEIQGKLLHYTPTAFTLQATDGTRYTVHTDSNVIGAFNINNPYDTQGSAVTIDTGDVLMVMYERSPGDSPTDIAPMQYHEIQLLLQTFSKDGKEPANQGKYHY